MIRKNFIGLMIWVISVFIGVSIGYCQAQKKPIARIYDAMIFLEDLQPPDIYLQKKQKETTQEALQEWLVQFQMMKFSQLINEKLIGRFLKEQNMEPTKQEIQDFMDYFKNEQRNRLKEYYRQKRELEQKISLSKINDTQRQEMTKQLETINQLIAYELKRQKEEKQTVGYEQVQENALQGVAQTTVRNWKFNKALYEKYGGRVIFQQAGAEPLDAYKTFWDEQRKNVEIFDQRFQPAFDWFEKYYNMDHSFVAKEDADKYFFLPGGRGKRDVSENRLINSGH